MRKILYVLLAAIISVAFLAACQATPNKPVVVQKDMQQMIDKAADENTGTKLDSLNIPGGRFTFEGTGAEGKLHISVDASVEKPESGDMPIVRASIGSFSQDTVTAVFNYLFPDKKPYDRVKVQTKADIQAIILNMQKKLADGSYKDNDYTEDEYKDLISQMEKAYTDAPETAPKQTISDGIMKRLQEKGGYMLDVASDTASLQVITPDPQASKGAKGGEICMLSYTRASGPQYNTLGITRTDGTDIPGDAKGKLTIAYADAKKLCDGFFSAAGIANDFCVGASFVVDDRGTGLSGGKFVDGKYIEGPKGTAKNYAYQFYYTRKAGDIPVAVNARSGGSTGDGFSVPWCYEFTCFTVDSNGISSILWTDPVTVGETVQNSSKLKPFDEIMQVSEAMIKTTYEAYLDTYCKGQAQMEVKVDDIQLCLLRVREQNGEETNGLLVPAWVFYGHNILQIAGDDNIVYDGIGGGGTKWPQAPIVLLAINAVDGSVIDLSKGY